MSIHDDREISVLIHLAAEFIAREAGRSTLITPTRAELSPDGKRAIVYVSVFPDTETAHALEFLSRNDDAFRSYMKKHARLAHLPRVAFQEDRGEKHRQRLDELSRDADSR